MALFSSPLARRVIGCAIEVHRTLGAGLLESTYDRCLAHELGLHGIRFQRQVWLPITYKTVRLDCGYRVDFLIEDGPLIEIKAVEGLLPIHRAQTITYLRLLRMKHGLLINFNVPVLRDGIVSLLNDRL